MTCALVAYDLCTKSPVKAKNMLIIQLLIIQVVTFIGLVLALRKLLYADSARALRRLERLNAQSGKKLEELRRKSEEAEKEYLEKIDHARREAEKIKELARAEAEEFKTKTLNKAEEEASRILAQARSTEEAIRSEIATQMRLESIEIASKLITKVFDTKIIQDNHKILVDELISGIERLNPDRIESGINEAEVVSAYSLNSLKLQKLENILSKKAGYRIHLKQKIDKKIIAGIILKIGNLIIDGSILNKLKEAKEELERNIT